MMVLGWRQVKQPLTLQWRGPNRVTTAISSVDEIMKKVAVIAGPIGAKGDKGDRGEISGVPTSLDGGNF